MLKNIRILIEDDGAFYKVGKVDAIDDGKGVIVYFDGTKMSRHEDGRTWIGPVGEGGERPVEVRVASSNITTETICECPIPSDITTYAKQYHGDPGKRSFTMSSAVLAHENAAIAFEIANVQYVDEVRQKWEDYSGVESASTYIDKGFDQFMIMAVRHSTGLK